MNKVKVNYWLDWVIAVAFVASAVSGVVFLLPPGNPTALGVSYRVWDQIHIWGSLLMIGGVVIHLALHWKWIVMMTKKTFAKPKKSVHELSPERASQFGRRQFIRGAGMGALVMGASVYGVRSLFGLFSNEAGQMAVTAPSASNLANDTLANGVSPGSMPSVSSPPVVAAPTGSPVIDGAVQAGSPAAATTQAATGPLNSQQSELKLPTATAMNNANSTDTTSPTATSGPAIALRSLNTATPVPPQNVQVQCRKGIVYDPYPGQCRHYVDRDGDGFCDYSIPL